LDADDKAYIPMGLGTTEKFEIHSVPKRFGCNLENNKSHTQAFALDKFTSGYGEPI
jgi:hypothetical protein